MPQGSLGKKVARAASSGGNRSHRGRRPMGWYASLVVIVLAGSALIGYSRYEAVQAASTSTTGATTTTLIPPGGWHTALAFDICGKQTLLPANSNKTAPDISTDGSGIVSIDPSGVTSRSAANEPTLANFVRQYQPKLTLTADEIRLPGNGQPLYKNGAPCEGKPGEVQLGLWSNVSAPSPSVKSGSAALDVGFANGQMITIAFLPRGASVPAPPPSVQKALLDIISPPATTTTVPKPTTTLKGKGSTTTTKPAATTTTSGSGTTTTTARPTTTT